MIKIVCGYRDDQSHPIPDEEAHKAYYLFLTPGSRAVFADGFAVRHEDVQRVEPDYHGTMGWNRAHRLDPDDLNEINASPAVRQLRKNMERAWDVARLAASKPELLALPLSAIPATVDKPLDTLPTGAKL